MPKNKFQEVIFTIIMVFVMVYAMICYNIVLNTGTKSKERYRAGHERDIILHEAAAKALKAAGITKLPNPAALQKEYEALQAQKEVLYADYGKLKKKVREYDVIKQNIDSILQTGKQPERGKEAERG